MTNLENKPGRTPLADYLWPIGLGLAVFLTRLPFGSQILYHWDSVNFALAMRQFDVLEEHPQPPGYIVYVWLCRLVDLVFHNANVTMVWISMAASGLAVVALYFVGRAMWGRTAGWLAALFLATSPLVWFYSEIALPHVLDLALMLWAVCGLYQIRQGRSQLLWPVIVLLGVIGGVRQQSLIFLLPLTLYAVWREGWKRLILAGGLGALVCAVWFVPLIVSSGGLGTYLDKMNTFSARFQSHTSILMGAGWPGIFYNARRLFLYTLWGGASALVPGLIYAGMRLLRWKWPRLGQRGVFLWLWATPSFLFYLLIHMGQQALIFTYLPALLLIGAVGLVRLLKPRGAQLAIACLAAANMGLFFFVPEYPWGAANQRLITRSALINTDRYYLDRIELIEANFSPESAVIVAANWQHVEYYLPRYRVLHLDGGWANRPANLSPTGWPGTGGEPTISDLGLVLDDSRRVAVIIFDEVIAQQLHLFGEMAVSLPDGGEMDVLWLKEGEQLQYNGVRLEVVKP